MDLKNTLKKIIDDYPDSWRNRQKFRALVADYFPTSKLYKNLLIISSEESIPEDIVREKTISDAKVHYLSTRIITASGCQENVAEEIIYAWLYALGYNFKKKKNKTPASKKIDESTLVQNVGLSSRIVNVLIREGINTIGDLIQYSEGQILALHGLGAKSVTELKQVLLNSGLSFASNSKIEISAKKKQDDISFIVNGTILIRYKKNSPDTEVKIPKGITEIAADAFSGSSIGSVIFPEGVIKIGSNAFKEKRRIISIYRRF